MSEPKSQSPKLLVSIKEDQIKSGISVSSAFAKSGLFSQASGVNPFVNFYPDSDNAGLLQAGPSPVDISSTVVVDNILAGAVSSDGFLYMLGDAGHLYKKDLSGDSAPSDLRGSPIGTCSNGLEIYQPQVGTKYLYYFQPTKIGRFDFISTYVDGWQASGITSSPYHPTHQFRGNIYFGNVSTIGKIAWDGSSDVTFSGNVLDFPADFINTCLEDDGTYLVIGVTKSTNILLKTETKVLFWDTNEGGSWNREWSIPDPAISAIRKFGSGFLAICSLGIYYFDFSTQPKKVRTINPGYNLNYGTPQASSRFADAVVWGGINLINSYGPMSPEDKNYYRIPFAGITGTIGFVNADARYLRIYVGANNSGTPKLYYYVSTAGGLTGVTASTVFIPLGAEYEISRLDFILGVPLLSGDVLTVTLQGDPTTSATALRNVQFATDGGKRFVKIDAPSFVCESLRLNLGFSAGNVKIKGINVYGIPHNAES